MICRCVDKYGASLLALARYRNVHVDGIYSASIFSIYPLPRSRYLMPRSRIAPQLLPLHVDQPLSPPPSPSSFSGSTSDPLKNSGWVSVVFEQEGGRGSAVGQTVVSRRMKSPLLMVIATLAAVYDVGPSTQQIMLLTIHRAIQSDMTCGR